MRPFLCFGVFAALLLPWSVLQADDLSGALARADKLEDGGQPVQAAELLETLDRASPGNPAVARRLSRVYADQIDLVPDTRKKRALARQALAYGQAAVAKAPTDGDAHLALAIAYGQMADYVDNRTKMEYSKHVQTEAERAIQLNPKLGDGYEVLARWNFEMATLNPILAGIAQVLYGQLPPASREQSFEYFRKAIASAPDQIGYHAEYARALGKSNRTAEANAEWRKVLQLPAQDAEDRGYQREAIARLK
ncbi:MAG TPA: hypothetical protein VGD78_18865 [Chthoniobacterales bacterium]